MDIENRGTRRPPLLRSNAEDGVIPDLRVSTAEGTLDNPSPASRANQLPATMKTTARKSRISSLFPVLPALRFVAALIAFVVLCSTFAPNIQAQDKPTRWTGTWNNKKYNTKGPLHATITPGKNGILKAKFTGRGIRSNFSFDADITKKKSGNRVTLSGKSKINGDQYQWTGRASSTTLSGSYRSRSGNNGSFTMKLVR